MIEFFTIIAFHKEHLELPQALPGSYGGGSHVRSYNSLGKARGYRTMATNQAARWGGDAPQYCILKVTVHNDGNIDGEWVE